MLMTFETARIGVGFGGKHRVGARRRAFRHCPAPDRRRLVRLRAAPVHSLSQALALWRPLPAALEGLHPSAACLRTALDLAGGASLPAAVARALPSASAVGPLALRPL